MSHHSSSGGFICGSYIKIIGFFLIVLALFLVWEVVLVSGLLSSSVRWTASPDSFSMAHGYSSGGLIPVTL